jgi:hypothetical protein
MEEMGYRNFDAVRRLGQKGKYAKLRADGTLSTSNAALLLLTYMASTTYDWDTEHNTPTADAKAKGYPCRYYKRGAESFAYDYGKLGITPEQAMSEDPQGYMDKRRGAANQEFKRAIKTLTDWGVIKQLERAKNGLPAGYLLLLGDDAENKAVEQWARRCLNLPMIW